MMKRIQAVATACLGVGLAFLPQAGQAQAVYGSVYGNVTDASGAAIPNATVTVTDEAKGTSVTTKSNESGGYSVEHLVPDQYTVKVEAPGFKGYETSHLQVFADASPKVDAVMQTGGASETVNVNADAVPQLQTDRAEVATTFDAKTTQDLPISGRNFTSLQLLLPGTQLLGWSHASSENPQGSQQIIVNGQHFAGVAYELDGTDNQDPMLGIIVINPSLESVSQSKIATVNYDAQFGKAVAAVITAQTKSGSNSFHGVAYDYRNSDAQQARNPFVNFAPNSITGRYLPSAVYNQFGGNIGGPILKDRLFFFADYQGVRQKVGSSLQTTVPTTLLHNSCLSGGCDFSDYGTPIYDPTTGQQFANNIIPANRVSQQAKNLLTLLPLPNGTGNATSQNYSGTGTGGFNNDQWTVRGDWQVTQRIHAFGRFTRFTDTLTGPVVYGAAGGQGFGIGGFGGTSKGANDSTAAGIDLAVNSSLLTDVRAGYYRYNITTAKYNQTVAFADQLGIPGLNTGTNFTSGAPGFFIDGNQTQNNLFQFGSSLNINRCNCPLAEHEDQYQIVNNWTKILGNHAIKFGADLRYARNLRVPSDTNRAGDLTFRYGGTASPDGDGGLGIASFFLGNVTNFGRFVSTSTNAKEFQKRTFFYVQDTWRVTPSLTVNYGVRYDVYWPEKYNGKGNGSLLDLATGNLNVAGFGKYNQAINFAPDAFAFAPRVGFAYQLNPVTVIRAGYGRSYDIGVFGSIFGHAGTQDLPVLANQNLNNAGAGSNTNVFNLANGPVQPTFVTPDANGNIRLPVGINASSRPNPLRLPQIDAWNLSVQRSITPTLSLTMAYVGNKGTHTFTGDSQTTNPNEQANFLPANESFNGQALHYDPSAPSTPTATGATSNQNYLQRFFASYGWTQGINFFQNGADTHYNALQVTMQKNFSKGLQFTANYAWQRGFNFNQSYFTISRRAVYGRLDDLRENQFVLFGNYELPFGRDRMFASNVNGVVNQIIGGWQLSGTTNWSSGLPFTLSYRDCFQDVVNTAPCYPNRNAGAVPLQLGDFDTTTHTRRYFTPVTRFSGRGDTEGAYSRPGLDEIGTNGRNTTFGPNFFNSDVSILKNFPIKESVKAQFRADAFNAFNHINPGQPANLAIDGNVSDNAGVITNTAIGASPRQLQFAVKIIF